MRSSLLLLAAVAACVAHDGTGDDQFLQEGGPLAARVAACETTAKDSTDLPGKLSTWRACIAEVNSELANLLDPAKAPETFSEYRVTTALVCHGFANASEAARSPLATFIYDECDMKAERLLFKLASTTSDIGEKPMDWEPAAHDFPQCVEPGVDSVACVENELRTLADAIVAGFAKNYPEVDNAVVRQRTDEALEASLREAETLCSFLAGTPRSGTSSDAAMARCRANAVAALTVEARRLLFAEAPACCDSNH